MPAAPDLASLVRRVAAGDPEAEVALVEHLTPRLRAMALARTRNADLARDLAQESLIAVLVAARKNQIRDLDRVMPFVCGVAKNILNNHQRRTTRLQEAPLDEESIPSRLPGLTTDEDYEDVERRRLMARALAVVAPGDRQVLLLTLVDGLKPGEIAERLGLSPEVVRARKSRALKRVLDAIDSQSRNPPPRY